MKNKISKKEYNIIMHKMKDALINAQDDLIKELKSGYGEKAHTESVENAKNQIIEFKKNNEII